jgi:hypothetical protein
LPASLIGMYGCMLLGMRDSMAAGSITLASAVTVGAIFGAIVVLARWIINARSAPRTSTKSANGMRPAEGWTSSVLPRTGASDRQAQAVRQDAWRNANGRGRQRQRFQVSSAKHGRSLHRYQSEDTGGATRKAAAYPGMNELRKMDVCNRDFPESSFDTIATAFRIARSSSHGRIRLSQKLATILRRWPRSHDVAVPASIVLGAATAARQTERD